MTQSRESRPADGNSSSVSDQWNKEKEFSFLPAVCFLTWRFLPALYRKVVREDGVDVFVELDVGSDYNSNDEQIRRVLYNVVEEGAIASYVTSVQGFQFRRLGEGKA